MNNITADYVDSTVTISAWLFWERMLEVCNMKWTFQLCKQKHMMIKEYREHSEIRKICLFESVNKMRALILLYHTLVLLRTEIVF